MRHLLWTETSLESAQGESHELLGETDGWYQISGGYISADYAEKRFCMNEANKLDMKAMVLNFYDLRGVSNEQLFKYPCGR